MRLDLSCPIWRCLILSAVSKSVHVEHMYIGLFRVSICVRHHLTHHIYFTTSHRFPGVYGYFIAIRKFSYLHKTCLQCSVFDSIIRTWHELHTKMKDLLHSSSCLSFCIPLYPPLVPFFLPSTYPVRGGYTNAGQQGGFAPNYDVA